MGWEPPRSLLPQTFGKLTISGCCFHPPDAAAPGVLQLLGSAGDGAFSSCPSSTRVSVPLHPVPGSLKPGLAGVVFSFKLFFFFFLCVFIIIIISSFSGQAIWLVGFFQPERPEACMSQAFPTSACITHCKCVAGYVSPFARGQCGRGAAGGTRRQLCFPHLLPDTYPGEEAAAGAV